MSSSKLAAGELSPLQKELLTEEETATIYTARAILEGLMTRERDADAVLEPEPEDVGKPEPEPEAGSHFAASRSRLVGRKSQAALRASFHFSFFSLLAFDGIT